MRRTRLLMTTAVLTAVMASGCGTELYTLTDKEETLLVNYAAHVVTKYNAYQKEGLTYVLEEEAEEEDTDASQGTALEDQEASDFSEETGTADTSAGGTYAEGAVTLNEVFGESDVALTYLGAQLLGSYVESDVYAMYPDSGKQYLVLGIDVANVGQTPVDIDYLSMKPEFAVVLNGEVHASSELTLLSQDFSTFDAILKAGEVRETILLFQVPDTVTSIESVELTVTTDKKYQIIL